jgi:hypothetical protein
VQHLDIVVERAAAQHVEGGLGGTRAKGDHPGSQSTTR